MKPDVCGSEQSAHLAGSEDVFTQSLETWPSQHLTQREWFSDSNNYNLKICLTVFALSRKGIFPRKFNLYFCTEN